MVATSPFPPSFGGSPWSYALARSAPRKEAI